MSGVYIKGMEMPTRCGRCDMCVTEADGDIDSHKACCITGAIIENLGEKMEDCPLIPVPDHGRLVDGDAIIGAYSSWIWVAPGEEAKGMRAIFADIRDAPTIIPASGGKENE